MFYLQNNIIIENNSKLITTIKPKQLRRKITKKVKKMQFSKKNIFFKRKREKTFLKKKSLSPLS